MSDRVLTYPDLKARKGISYTRQHLSRLEEKGLWPQRIQYGPGRVGWLESEVDEHLSKQPRGPLPMTVGQPRVAEQSA